MPSNDSVITPTSEAIGVSYLPPLKIEELPLESELTFKMWAGEIGRKELEQRTLELVKQVHAVQSVNNSLIKAVGRADHDSMNGAIPDQSKSASWCVVASGFLFGLCHLLGLFISDPSPVNAFLILVGVAFAGCVVRLKP